MANFSGHDLIAYRYPIILAVLNNTIKNFILYVTVQLPA